MLGKIIPKAFIILSFTIFSNGQTNLIDRKIVGGKDADISSFPFLLSLRFYTTHFCGANAISPYWAVTAAHCLDKNLPINSISFRVGSTSRYQGGTIIKAAEYILHPKFLRKTLQFDVAVVRAANPFPISSFALIPVVNTAIPTGARVVVAGWGSTERGSLAENLLKVTIPVLSETRCQNAWRYFYSETVMCAGRLNRDSCSGDSGGGLWLRSRILIGIVSFGPLICGSKQPGVYTKIFYKPILEFISNNTGIHPTIYL